jgi:predicted GIY-YIG superfamily endonuclease
VSTERPAFVYRTFDAEGRLLYIGMTYNLGKRFYEHERKAKWWADFVDLTVTAYPNRDDAAAAEWSAIRYERPLHNVRSGICPISGPYHALYFGRGY